ncbi:MAG: ThuA domain-containing protein [Puniceicoccales bacterium]|jgi:nicotinamidase-related amidase|nr:ThuA domain-containing protein [Puniceicoccales bacterium]
MKLNFLNFPRRFAAAFLAFIAPIAVTAFAAETDGTLRVTLQDRVPFDQQLRDEIAALSEQAKTAPAKTAAKLRNEIKRLEGIAKEPSADALSVRQSTVSWKAAETAIIICDMWDKHWCKHATARVGELAPTMNEVLTIAREKGVSIVHAPSDCLGFYNNHPARKKAEKYRTSGGDPWSGNLPSEKGAKWPVAQRDSCPECRNRRAWSRQVETLTIKDEDFISANGKEVRGYLQAKGVKNVILLGVHTNMCVIGRPFGLRAMKAAGFNTVLMRDMTDLIYNNVVGKNQFAPFVNHFSGLDLMVAYIETYVTPTILSSDFTGKKQFRFKEDTRPRVTFLAAESEYRASLSLQNFAHELTLRDIHADFALGKPIMEGAGRHSLENLQALDDANLAVFFIRRRALDPEKMERVKNYVASGRPVFGIRTASHAFDAKGNVPRDGGAIVASNDKTANLLAQWRGFDKEVLGGNYQGHYGHFKAGTDIAIATGNESHPILKGVDATFNSPSWLYINNPLNAKDALVLLTGKDPGPKNKRQPVLWVNGKVVYTSLGHWDDWKIPSFKKLAHNTVDFLVASKK